MKNNKRGRGDKEQADHKQDKPSSKPSRRSTKSGDFQSDRSKKPYNQNKPTESGNQKSSGYKKDKPAAYRKDKQSGFEKDKPLRPGRYKSGDSSEDKTPGYRRGSTSDSGEYKSSGFRKPKPSYDTGKLPTRKPRPVKADPSTPIRLNKFIANAGVCSRREADKLIETGAVKLNGVIVTELGTKVGPSDKVQLGDQTLSSEKLRYVLLNKPKGFITTTDDPFKRNTVMKIVGDACKERIYPVGRLDRNTTGLLLFTNDGELAKRLTHPRFGVRKIYDVELDKPLTKNNIESIASGVELDGETIIIDEIAWVESEKNKKHVGIQLHSGQNRVVRRIFEKFGYEVLKLDRVMIGSLTKKELPRGMWRHLNDLEVRMLKRL